MEDGHNDTACAVNATQCMGPGETYGPSTSLCNASHTGPVCAICYGDSAEGHRSIGGTDQMCESCAGHTVTNWLGVVASAAAFFAALGAKHMLDSSVKPRLDKFRKRRAARQRKALLQKIQ
eukprot:COSAG04_NODE_22109_length_361_cov_0.595420_1_plen_120_part_11